MVTNFLNLWILARLIQAGAAALLCALGAAAGCRIVRRWRSGQSCEAQLALERQAELVASVMQGVLLLEVLGLALSILVTDHLVGGIRGAMCAFGVLAATRTGHLGLLVSAVTAVACALWMIFHAFDLTLDAPVLTRRKFFALLAVAPLTLLDFALALQFVLDLDFQVIASCCSTWVDGAAINTRAARLVLSPTPAGVMALTVTGLALLAGAVQWRRPRRAMAFAAAAVSGLAPVAVLPAILGVVAPYALATPGHLCPFCLFHAQGGYVGWPLFGAMFVGSVAGLGSGLVEWNRRGAGADGPADAMERTLGQWSALAWALAALAGLFPVVRYLLRSGGIAVFGEV